MAQPKFYLEPRPSADGKQNINLFYSFNGQRLQYYTGVRVEVKHYQSNCNTGSAKPIKSIAPYAALSNSKLEDLKADAMKIVSEAKGDNLNVKYVREQLDLIYKPKPIEPTAAPEIKQTFISYFEQAIKESEDGKRRIRTGKNKGKRYTHNAIKNYRTSLAAIKRFMAHNKIKDLSFEQIDNDFYDNFFTFCFDVQNKEISTFNGYIKDIKTIMKENKTVGFDSEYFIQPQYEADTIYLTLSEIDKIAELDLSDYTKTVKGKAGELIEKISYAALDKARNLALIGFYTGLRHSDFSNLDIKSINGNFIDRKQQKTGDRITIPIMSRLHPVLAKYPEALPTLSNQKFNFYIKMVAKLAGLTEKRTLTNTKGNKTNETTAPLYTLISSHCCRRSYATNMFKVGVPPMLIMAATGHRTEQNFLKYIRASNNDKAILLAAAMEKLGL